MKIRNYRSLTDHGDTESRKIVLDITERTLEHLDSYKLIKSITSFDGHILKIGNNEWNLDTKKNVYLIGAGKACNHMARAIDEILGARLTRGIAIVKILEESDVFNKTEVYIGGHPLPNEAGYQACLKIIDMVKHAGPDDLFIVVISGGSSALMSCPIEGISLEDEIKMTVIATGFKKDDGKIAFPEIRVPAKPVEEAPVAEAAAEPEKAETKEDEIDDTDDDFLKLLNDITKNK